MSWQGNFDVNYALSGGTTGDRGKLVWQLKEALVDAGIASVVQSGDTISWHDSDLFTSPPDGDYADAPAAGDWSQPSCWMVLRFTGTTIELCFWRSSSAVWSAQNQMMVLLTPTGFDDNTNRTNSHPPESSDEIEILGSKPGTFASYILGASGSAYSHVGVDDAADENGAFSFYQFATDQGTGAVQMALLFTGLIDPVDNDPQPWAIHHSGTSSALLASYLNSDTYGPRAYRDYGGGTELFGRVPANVMQAVSTTSVPGNLSVQVDGYTRLIHPMLHSITNGHYKGFMRFFRWKPISGRGYPDRDDPTGGDDLDPKIYAGDLVLPWPANVTPL